MNPFEGKILINGAPSQYERWLEALDDDYVKVDGRSFSQLMEFSVEFGKLINFYNLENKVDGDWSDFFSSDQVSIFSLLEAWDVKGLENEYRRLRDYLSRSQDAEQKLEGLREVFGLILSIALSINDLIRACMSHAGSGLVAVLYEELQSCVKDKLRNQIRLLCAYAEGAGVEDALGETMGLDYSRLLPLWGVSQALSDSSIYQGESRREKIDSALGQLDPLFGEFLTCLSNLKLMVGESLLKEPIGGDVRPQIALYIAFVKLFRHAQDSLNTLSRRYREFYYHGVLKEPGRGLVPDSVYLSLSLDEDESVTQADVPEGTLFQATPEEGGEEVLYASDRSLAVTQVRIGRIRTLRVVHGELLGHSAGPVHERNQGQAADVIKRIIQAEVSVEDFSAQTPWESFGEVRSLDTPRVVSEPAVLGFAIASSCLLLEGGERKIALEIELPAEYVLQTLLPLLEALAEATGLGVADVLRSILQHGLKFCLSTSEGWLNVDSFGAELYSGTFEEPATPVGSDLGLKTIILNILLPDSAPGIGPLIDTAEDVVPAGDESTGSDSLAGNDFNANPNPSLPTLKAYLNQNPLLLQGNKGAVEVSPVSVLGGMRFEDITLKTHVVGLSNLSLENTDGEIDTSSPFPMFGSNPVLGSYLLIYADEIFQKYPSELCLDLKWFALPVNEEGFYGYYKDYVIGPDGKEHSDLFKNSSFQVSVDVFNPGSWRLWNKHDDCPENPQKAVTEFLFRTKKDDDCVSPEYPGSLCGETQFNNLKACPSGIMLSEFYDAQGSAIRIELTDPPYTFGNDIYAKNVLNSVIEDLPDTDACKDRCLCDCQSLAFAESAIEGCISKCVDYDATQYRQCVQPCLADLLEKLFLALVQCATGCAIEGTGAWGSREVTNNVEGIRRALALPDAARVLALEESMSDLANIEAGQDGKKAAVCIERCRPILESMLCVSKCALVCGQLNEGEYKPCMLGCLEDCKETVGEAYKQCLTECMDECMEIKTPVRYPNEPYLPQLEAVSLSYCAQAGIFSSGETESAIFFYHLLPFGGYKEKKTTVVESSFLFPQFDYTGNAYIGLSGLNQAQVLSLLFYLATKSSRFPANAEASVSWSVLVDNRWQSIDASDMRADTTNGLLNTGIISLMLSNISNQNNTVLSSDYAWLRIGVGEDPGGYPMTVGIYPHVLIATRQIETSGEADESMTLPAGSISESVQVLEGISSIQQPVASFGGRARESEKEYAVRLGERLRHKSRAIQGWDYERLLLERFPDLWKAQALPCRDSTGGNRPGSVLVVVVAGDDSEEVLDPTAPAVSSRQLKDIKTFLMERASSFVDISVVNPLYIRIEVIATIKIRDTEMTGDRTRELNNDLVSYLSPWFFSVGRAKKGAFYATETEIYNFIRDQSYVEYIDAIEFRYYPDPGTIESDWCFATSAHDHDISSVNEVRLIEDTSG